MKVQEFSWHESLSITYEELTAQIISIAPQLIGALAILIVGWIIALILRVVTRKLVRGFDSLFNTLAKKGGARQEAIKRSYAKVVSRIVFWIVMLFFIAAAANLLGWNMFSTWMDKIITYLPNLVSGLLIILAGFILSGIARAGIVNTTSSAGISQGSMLARIAQIVILFTAMVVGIEQIGINVDFLTNVLIVVVGVLLFGGALAFGLGAKTLVANIIGAQYLRKHCRIGEKMQVGDVEGVVVEVTQTMIVLDANSVRVVVPAKKFQEVTSSFSSPVKNTQVDESSSGNRGAENDRS